MFNPLIICFSAYFLAFKTLFTYKLIKGSIVNANEYRDINVAQVNFGYQTHLNFSLREFYNIFKRLQCFKRNRKRDGQHIEFNQSIHEKIPRSRTQDLILFFNLFSFEDQYTLLGDERIDRREEMYKNWHSGYPLHRMSIGFTQSMIIAATYVNFSIVLPATLVFYVVAYIDVTIEFGPDYSFAPADFLQQALTHYSSPPKVVRLLELYVLIGTQIAQIYDVAKLFFDIHVAASRATKLIDALEEQVQFRRYFIKLKYQDWPNSSLLSTSEKILFNKQLRHLINLARLFNLEFASLKIAHNSYLSLSCLCNGICVAIIINTMTKVDNLPEFIFLVVAFLSCGNTLVYILIYCAILSSKVGFALLED